MRTPPSWSRYLAAVLVAVASFPAAPPRAAGGELLGKMFRGMGRVVDGHHARPPATESDCCVERLGREIDWLENYIERYGSVVPKSPDVWGQSRLTRHRDEYEKLLYDELGNFTERNNASLRRSDQSYLGLALALQSATSGPVPAGPIKKDDVSSSAAVMNLITTGTAGNEQTPTFRSAPFASSEKSFAGFQVGDGSHSGSAFDAIGLEPTIHLDHLDRYIKHLQELRRINEGDDNSDSPGYALNLVRIPVSILPGEYTQKGHGAEITVTADVQLGDDLLPTMFRNLVDNDIVDLLAPPLTFLVNDAGCRRARWGGTPPGDNEPKSPGSNFEASNSGQTATNRALLTQAVKTARSGQGAVTVSVPSPKTRRARLPIPAEQVFDVVGLNQVTALLDGTYEALGNSIANGPCIQYMDVRTFLQDELEGAQEFLARPQFAELWAELPSWNLPELIRGRRLRELEQVRCRFLNSLGTTFGPPGQHADFPEVIALPGSPTAGCGESMDGGPCCNDTECTSLCTTTTGVLAWMILVESSLLNERLIEDMQTAASSQGRMPPGGQWSGPYFGPAPAPEARRSFNEYVRLRWPIHVFALDPVIQEQNIEDMYSQQRELQIAMAVAASGGRSGAQAAMRYARRLETDMATIALNKTAVAFSHGDDTFGWRFYPRFQSPPTRNNFAAFADTLVGSNSQKRDFADRRLEPGIRECTAIIVMPSFIPYVTFDVRTNWFSLNHPKPSDLNMRQTLELSRSVKVMQNSAAQCSQCAGLYRDGEVARLMRRVEQLDRRLPLQSMLTQIPYENTSGGFELFNTGITDLAPELIGWYGADGIDPSQPTTLYIIGKGFSVHDTSIVAGGQEVPIELISRQVLRAKFPKGLKAAPRPEAAKVECQTAAAALSRRIPGRIGAAPARALAASRPSHGVRLASDSELLPEPNPLRAHQSDPGIAAASGVKGRTISKRPAQSIATIPAPDDAPDAAGWDKEGEEKTRSYSALKFRIKNGNEVPREANGIQPSSTGNEGDPAGAAGDCNKRPVITVHLATPYGVSNQLLVPLVPEPKCPAPTPDAAACGLLIEPPVSVALTATRTTLGTWRVNEYFDAVPDAIAIHAPKWFTPPGDAEVRWTVRDGAQGPVIANFAVPAPHFEAAARAYVLDGGELRNLIGDTSRPATDKTLRGAIKPYLDFVGKTIKDDPGKIDRDLVATAELVTGQQTIPIDGTITVTLHHGDQPLEDR